MKQRNKRQLLAAMAAMAILVPVGGVSFAAPEMNGQTPKDPSTGKEINVIDNNFVVNTAKSGKWVVGHGDVSIQTQGNAGILFGQLKDTVNDFKTAMESGGTGMKDAIDSVKDALTPRLDNTVLVGVVGGEGQMDKGFTDLLQNSLINTALDGAPGRLANLNTINKDENADPHANLSGDVNYVVGANSEDAANPVILGAVGGDASINAGINGQVKGTGLVG